jgi:phospholipase/lecithinase/hemolysin
MKKGFVFLLAGILLAGAALAGCAGKEEPISHVYAFGDDHSDNGNYSKYDQEWPSEINWEGRLSNGPLAVEVLAEQLNVDLTDYAYCAAMSGDSSLQFAFAGLLSQVDKFESELKGNKADPSALYFIEIGMVDFYMSGDPGTGEEVVANIVTAVTRLAELGAKRFIIGNSLNLDNFPGFIREGMSNRAEKFYTNMNTILPGEMEKLAQELKVQIEIFDMAAAAKQIQSNPEQYGFTELVRPCTQLPIDYSAEICANPDEYYYWGYYYLTHHVHQILGEAMAKQVSE